MVTITKRFVVTFLMGVALAAGVGSFVGANTHVYNGQNAGVQFASVGGVEVKGTPGFFWCDGQC